MAPLAVLHVEDEPLVARRVVRGLRPHGFEVTTAASLAEAKHALESGTAFAAAIVDLRLPDGSGMDLLEELSKLGIPAVVMSGHFEAAHALQCIATDVDVIPKPVGAARLAECLRMRISRPPKPSRPFATRYGMSERLLDVIECAADGLETTSTAKQLGITPRTVRDYWDVTVQDGAR